VQRLPDSTSGALHKIEWRQANQQVSWRVWEQLMQAGAALARQHLGGAAHGEVLGDAQMSQLGRMSG